jgi:hypothetical protein
MEHLPANIARRFWRKARRSAEMPGKTRKPLIRPCLVWEGARDNKGYGVFRAFPGCMGLKSGIVRAHRLSYWLTYGPFPRNAQIDHECFNTLCLEPTHLRLVGITEHGHLSKQDQLDAETEEEILEELREI